MLTLKACQGSDEQCHGDQRPWKVNGMQQSQGDDGQNNHRQVKQWGPRLNSSQLQGEQ